MKILFDHNIPRPLRRYLSGHLIFSARSMGWDRVANGELIRAAESQAFDLLITADQSIFYQQNNDKRRIALVVLESPSWPLIESAHQKVLTAVESSSPGSFEYIRLYKLQ